MKTCLAILLAILTPAAKAFTSTKTEFHNSTENQVATTSNPYETADSTKSFISFLHEEINKADRPYLTQEIITHLIDQAQLNLDEKFLDPFCGSGSIILAVSKYLEDKCITDDDHKKLLLNTNLHHQNLEVSGDLTHELKFPKNSANSYLNSQNFFGETSSDSDLKEYDVIITSPPYNYTLTSANTLRLFERCISLLKPGGKAVVVLPSWSYGTRVYEFLKQRSYVIEDTPINFELLGKIQMIRPVYLKKFTVEEERAYQEIFDRRSLYTDLKASFVWKDSIDAGSFEDLVLELVKRETGNIWARKLTVVNQSDGGRDILSEWWTLPFYSQLLREPGSPYSIKRIAIQAKAFKGAVGQSKVQNISDILDNHENHGYLLVVSSQLTKDLTEYLEKLRYRGKHWVNWWTRSEVEERLRVNLDIAYRFPDIVEVKLGDEVTVADPLLSS